MSDIKRSDESSDNINKEGTNSRKGDNNSFRLLKHISRNNHHDTNNNPVPNESESKGTSQRKIYSLPEIAQDLTSALKRQGILTSEDAEKFKQHAAEITKNLENLPAKQDAGDVLAKTRSQNTIQRKDQIIRDRAASSSYRLHSDYEQKMRKSKL